MRFSVLCLVGMMMLGVSVRGAETPGKKAEKKTPPVILLKLDDVTAAGAHGNDPVSPRWQRVADYIEKNNLKGSFGIIGHALDEDNPALFKWIKDLNKRGRIEFWNHGYIDRKAEDKLGEFERSYEEQKSSLEKTQRLAKEKLGFELKAFGAHWSGANAETAKALENFPEIKMVFYFPETKGKLLFERVLTLENPTFVPDFEKFKAIYASHRAADKPVLALQGHPNQWDDKRWAGFVQIVEWLKAQGCVFMTPSEYLARKAEKK